MPFLFLIVRRIPAFTLLYGYSTPNVIPVLRSPQATPLARFLTSSAILLIMSTRMLEADVSMG